MIGNIFFVAAIIFRGFEAGQAVYRCNDGLVSAIATRKQGRFEGDALTRHSFQDYAIISHSGSPQQISRNLPVGSDHFQNLGLGFQAFMDSTL